MRQKRSTSLRSCPQRSACQASLRCSRLPSRLLPKRSTSPPSRAAQAINLRSRHALSTSPSARHCSPHQRLLRLVALSPRPPLSSSLSLASQALAQQLRVVALNSSPSASLSSLLVTVALNLATPFELLTIARHTSTQLYSALGSSPSARFITIAISSLQLVAAALKFGCALPAAHHCSPHQSALDLPRLAIAALSVTRHHSLYSKHSLHRRRHEPPIDSTPRCHALSSSQPLASSASSRHNLEDVRPPRRILLQCLTSQHLHIARHRGA